MHMSMLPLSLTCSFPLFPSCAPSLVPLLSVKLFPSPCIGRLSSLLCTLSFASISCCSGNFYVSLVQFSFFTSCYAHCLTHSLFFVSFSLVCSLSVSLCACPFPLILLSIFPALLTFAFLLLFLTLFIPLSLFSICFPPLPIPVWLSLPCLYLRFFGSQSVCLSHILLSKSLKFSFSLSFFPLHILLSLLAPSAISVPLLPPLF